MKQPTLQKIVFVVGVLALVMGVVLADETAMPEPAPQDTGVLVWLHDLYHWLLCGVFGDCNSPNGPEPTDFARFLEPEK